MRVEFNHDGSIVIGPTKRIVLSWTQRELNGSVHSRRSVTWAYATEKDAQREMRRAVDHARRQLSIDYGWKDFEVEIVDV